MSQIRLRVDNLERKRKELKWTKTRLANRIGISLTTLYRASLNPKNHNYDRPGEKFITGVLDAFPGAVFDDFFFLD